MADFFDKKAADPNEVEILTDRLRELEQKRREDLFYFMFAVILIIDAALFTILKNGLAAVTIGVLQVIFLLSIAHRFNIRYVDEIFKKCISILGQKTSN